MEPVPSGNLPPGFDTSSCRSVYVGNIHVNVTESLLAEVFQSTGPLEGCKLIKKEKSSFGFVDYHDRRSAALAIMTLHGRQLYGQAIKVNWAYASGQREDTSGHFNIFVGDLSPEVTDATLFACFSVYPSCSLEISAQILKFQESGVTVVLRNSREDARVMWDHKTGRSRGFGFVSFRNQQDAQSAINDLTGKWLGNRQIRCNWAAKGAGDDKKTNDNQNMVVLTNGSAVRQSSMDIPKMILDLILAGRNEHLEVGKGYCRGWCLLSLVSDLERKKPAHFDYTSEEAPENNPSFTTVYIGNLAHELSTFETLICSSLPFSFALHNFAHAQVTQVELHRQFHALGAGVIEEVRIQRDKGFGFVRYHTHEEAALAIQMANGRMVFGKSMKCSWGSKPTPPGTASNPLPPPVPPYQILPNPGMNQGYSAAELLAYQRQLALNQAAGSGLSGQALMQMAGQQGLAAAAAAAAQASVGLSSGGSQAMYDGYPNNSLDQQLMYYQ
ncbi:hypothetical protein HHK36_013459 [Tetracentron sinense]|uniref:RRM domain-containing protein n=1 Tax=Tetracentron sinense TaxID=13715 RepID=A0A834Z870_TETSI|nr:hypothetical protein HHK36_013459 [Tetracentron sinense]